MAELFVLKTWNLFGECERVTTGMAASIAPEQPRRCDGARHEEGWLLWHIGGGLQCRANSLQLGLVPSYVFFNNAHNWFWFDFTICVAMTSGYGSKPRSPAVHNKIACGCGCSSRSICIGQSPNPKFCRWNRYLSVTPILLVGWIFHFLLATP